jgi:competence protein ComEA
MKQMKTIGMVCWILVFFSASWIMAGQQATAPKASGGDGAVKLININSASATELTALPRIGEKISERIVLFRKENGPFKRKQDIMKVKGIGEKVYALIENRITV